MSGQIPLFGDIQPKVKRRYDPSGYAANPGSGPDGETCKSCKYATRLDQYNKRYWKCILREANWTRSYGTDIRLKSPACRHWEAKP